MLGVTDEAAGGRVETDVSVVVDIVCEPFRTALLFSLLSLIMWYLLGFSFWASVLLGRTRTAALA